MILARLGQENFILQSVAIVTTKQFALLLTLAQHESEILSTPYLYETVWGQPMNRDSQALRRLCRKCVARLRVAATP